MNHLFKTAFFSEVGKRKSNEDAVFPLPEDMDQAAFPDNLFVVCDGMGGHQKGEIASRYICNAMAEYFTGDTVLVSDRQIIRNAVGFAESKLDEYLEVHPESSGMGTTMTLLHLHGKGASIAHIGDSRVYLFRNGKIIFRTEDHSFVQELYGAGAITADEMRTHPRRNEITKAVRGASVKAVGADVKVWDDLQVNDIFLLCTDGVIETFTDEELETLFSEKEDIRGIRDLIVSRCSEESSDNFSGYLVQLQEAYIGALAPDLEEPSAAETESAFDLCDTIPPLPVKEQEIAQSENDSGHDMPDLLDVHEKEAKQFDRELKAILIRRLPIFLAAFLAGLLVIYYLFNFF